MRCLFVLVVAWSIDLAVAMPAGAQGGAAVVPPAVPAKPARCGNLAPPPDGKTDSGSIGKAVEAIARLQQCQVTNWNIHNTDHSVKDTGRIAACIRRTLDNGAFYWLSVTDLKGSELAGNQGVIEARSCFYGQQAKADTTAERDWVAWDLSHVDGTNRLEKPLPTVHTVRYRIIGGFGEAAASGTDPQAQFLAVASAQFPLASYQDLTAPVWLWGDLRVGSIAQPGALSTLQPGSGISSYVTPASASPGQIVQSIEFHAGLDKSIWMWGKNQTPNTISAVVTSGIITPLSTSQWAPLYYVASQDVQAGLEADPQYANDNLAAKFQAACNTKDSSGNLTSRTCYVAFPPKDRTTLYHDYGAGARLKWYWYDGVSNKYLYPSIVDAIVGQSEYVTGGRWHGAVLHFGGSTPIPQYPMVYLFGSFDTRITGKPSSGNPLLLVQATGTNLPTALTSDTVVPIQVDQPDRDRWQIGIGFDLRTIVDHWSKK